MNTKNITFKNCISEYCCITLKDTQYKNIEISNKNTNFINFNIGMMICFLITVYQFTTVKCPII